MLYTLEQYVQNKTIS
jgi:hypothetical protein